MYTRARIYIIKTIRLGELFLYFFNTHCAPSIPAYYTTPLYTILPAHPFMFGAHTTPLLLPLRIHFLYVEGHCATEPLQQKGDGRFAYNYTRWRWRRRRSTSLRLVLTTGPRPESNYFGRPPPLLLCVLWRRGGSKKTFTG